MAEPEMTRRNVAPTASGLPWANAESRRILVTVGRRQPRSPDTKHRLKSAAARVFTTRGYRTTGVDHIVDNAGTTRGAFYYYFTGKADVARDIQEEMWSAAGGRAEGVVDPEDVFLSKSRRVLEAYLATLEELGPERAFLLEAFAEPELAMVDRKGTKWGRHFISDFLTEATERGEIPRQDLELPTTLLHEALQALTLTALKGEDVTAILRVIDGLNQALVAGGLAKDPDPSPTTGPPFP